MEVNKIYSGNCLDVLRNFPDESIHTCVTSPPYWGLRDYGVSGQLGLESTPDEYVAHMVEVFREVRRVLRDDGTLWLNLGDSYAAGGKSGAGETRNPSSSLTGGKSILYAQRRAPIPYGLKPKDLVGIPWRVAFALQADGWYLRSDIIWHKPNPMPESVKDRPTKAHEYIFLLSKSERYYYDGDAIKEEAVMKKGENRGGSLGRGPVKEPTGKIAGFNHSGAGFVSDGKRNKRSVWTVATKPFKGAHFATFPPDLIEPCILAGCPEGGTVLDPFFGAGTTGFVAMKNNRNYIGVELNPEYIEIANKRLEACNLLHC